MPGGDGDLPARIYRPDVTARCPRWCCFHGGGWVIGDLETHDNTARAIARDARAVVVSVDYRLAPEAPVPGRRRRRARRHPLGGRRTSPSSAATTRSRSPATAPAATSPPSSPRQLRTAARRAAADLPGHRHARRAPVPRRERHRLLPRRRHHGVVLRALRRPRRPTSTPRLSPMLGADLAGLPRPSSSPRSSTRCATRARPTPPRCAAAGVRVEARRFDGMIHGFFDMGRRVRGRAAAVSETCAAVRGGAARMTTLSLASVLAESARRTPTGSRSCRATCGSGLRRPVAAGPAARERPAGQRDRPR